MVGEVEVVGVEHLIQALHPELLTEATGCCGATLGLNPVEKHIGWKVLALQLRRMLDANANVMVFLADWLRVGQRQIQRRHGGHSNHGRVHARNLQSPPRPPTRRNRAGRIAIQVGLGTHGIQRLLGRVRCSKGATLAMVRKTFTIMGRDEASSDRSPNSTTPPCRQRTFSRWTLTSPLAAWTNEKPTCSCGTLPQNTVGRKQRYTPSFPPHLRCSNGILRS